MCVLRCEYTHGNSENGEPGMRWQAQALLIVLLSGCAPSENAGHHKRSSSSDYRTRIGVVSLSPDLVPLAEQKLPIGFYKDYSCFGLVDKNDRQTSLTYMPVIQYKSKTDSEVSRLLVRLGWDSGKIPRLPGLGLDRLLVTMDRQKMKSFLSQTSQPNGIPPGTMFLLGNEPGYRPNNDSRTADEIVHDAQIVRKMLSDANAGHKLALGGMSTAKNQMVRDAYNGQTGNEFFRDILKAAAGKVSFDGFVIHPYPSDIHRLAAQESFDQIIEFRKIMSESGQRDKPLFVGEVGTPFPDVRNRSEEVERYLQDLLVLCLTRKDSEIGMPSDGNLLVQRLTWYLLCVPENPVAGFTDNPGLDLGTSSLMHSDGTLTDLGEVLVGTVSKLQSENR